MPGVFFIPTVPNKSDRFPMPPKDDGLRSFRIMMTVFKVIFFPLFIAFVFFTLIDQEFGYCGINQGNRQKVLWGRITN